MKKMTLAGRKPLYLAGLILLLVSLFGLWVIRIDLLVVRGSRALKGEECTHLYLLSLGPLAGIREVTYISPRLESPSAPHGLGKCFSDVCAKEGIDAACRRVKACVAEALGRPLDYYLYLEPARMAAVLDGGEGTVLYVARQEQLRNREGEVIAELSPGPTRLSGGALQAYLGALGEDGLEVVRRDIECLEGAWRRLLRDFVTRPRLAWRLVPEMARCLEGEVRWWEILFMRPAFSAKGLRRAGWRPLGPVPREAESGTGVPEEVAPEEKEERPEAQAKAAALGGLRVIVLNGCGKQGVAHAFADGLTNWGLKVVETENADNWEYSATVIIDMGRAAEKAAELGRRLGLSGKQVVRDIEESGQAEVTIILGADYERVLEKMASYSASPSY